MRPACAGSRMRGKFWPYYAPNPLRGGAWPPKTYPCPLVPLHRPRPIHSTRPAAGMRFALELVPLHRPRPIHSTRPAAGMRFALELVPLRRP